MQHADDHLVKDADVVAADVPVADDHVVGTDHSRQLDAGGRLADDAQAAQSGGGGDHVDGLHGATFMRTVSESVVGSTPKYNTTSISSCPSKDKRPMALSSKCATGTIAFLLVLQYSGRAPPVVS